MDRQTDRKVEGDGAGTRIRQTQAGKQTDSSMDRQTDRKVEGDGVGRLTTDKFRYTDRSMDRQTERWRETE